VPNSAMMAVLGRMAGYSGDVITWDEAINSTEDNFPKNLDLAGAMPTPPVAVPGRTEFQWLKDIKEARRTKSKQNA